MTLLIVQNRQINGARDVVDLEFSRRANVNNFWEFLEGKWKGDALGKFHEFQGFTSTIRLTSTATPRGKEEHPTAVRECFPISPKISTRRSDAPFTT